MTRRVLLWVLMLFAASLMAGESYSFLFFSDPHFGESSSYARRPDDPTRYVTKKDVFRSDRSHDVYQALFEQMAGAFGGTARFVVECGDFVEGLHCDGGVHSEQIRKHWNWMTGILKKPVYPVMGNHDSVGNGGKEAFAATLGAEIERLTGQRMLGCRAQYYFRRNDDFFVVLDYYDSQKSRLAFLESALKAFHGTPRHLFVISHQNIVQMARNSAAVEFLNAIKVHRPIILCGHTHATLLLDYEDASGRVTQFSIGTMLQPTPSANAFKGIKEDKDGYFGSLEAYYTQRKMDFQTVKAAVLPNIRRVWRVSGQGVAKLDVSDSGVAMTLQSGDVSQAPIQMTLR